MAIRCIVSAISGATVNWRIFLQAWAALFNGMVLLDFVDVVVHIFHKDKRGYYALEDLWGDAASRRYENVA